MSDDTEDTLDERLESIMRRAENFRDVLREGDEVTIALQDGDVHVAESYRSQFERKHAKLLGRMLAIEAQMEAGMSGFFVALVLAGVVIIGLQVHWWDAVLGEALNDLLQSWWFYLTLPISSLYLAHLAIGRYEKYVYQRNRPALMALIAADQLDRDILLVMLRDEIDLDNVVYQLKRDAGPFPVVDKTRQAPG